MTDFMQNFCIILLSVCVVFNAFQIWRLCKVIEEVERSQVRDPFPNYEEQTNTRTMWSGRN